MEWIAITTVLLSCCNTRRAPHIIQSQLSEVMTTVVYSDYPQAWPGLLEAVMAHLTSNVSRRCTQAAGTAGLCVQHQKEASISVAVSWGSNCSSSARRHSISK